MWLQRGVSSMPSANAQPRSVQPGLVWRWNNTCWGINWNLARSRERREAAPVVAAGNLCSEMQWGAFVFSLASNEFAPPSLPSFPLLLFLSCPLSSSPSSLLLSCSLSTSIPLLKGIPASPFWLWGVWFGLAQGRSDDWRKGGRHRKSDGSHCSLEGCSSADDPPHLALLSRFWKQRSSFCLLT